MNDSDLNNTADDSHVLTNGEQMPASPWETRRLKVDLIQAESTVYDHNPNNIYILKFHISIAFVSDS